MSDADLQHLERILIESAAYADVLRLARRYERISKHTEAQQLYAQLWKEDPNDTHARDGYLRCNQETSEELLTRMRTFSDKNMHSAFHKAKHHAGNTGTIASMPQLLAARTATPPTHCIWKNWYNTHSEENIGTTPAGNPVIILVHGGGLITPERIRTEPTNHPLPIPYTTHEFHQLLEGKLPDTTIPILTFKEFENIHIHFPRYAVILDFAQAITTPVYEYEPLNQLLENPLFIARAGGRLPAHAYLEKAAQVYQTKKYGNWHAFDNTIYPEQPHGHLLVISRNKYGMYSTQLRAERGHFAALSSQA